MIQPRRSALALAAALAVAAVMVALQGHVLLQRCVPVGGSWTGTAVSLAVVREAPWCPDGSLGLGALPSGAIVLLSVALPVLVAWAVGAALGVSLAAIVLRVARVVVGLVGRWVRPPLRRAALPVPDPTACVVALPPARPRALSLIVARPHRGPPLPA